MTGLNLLAAFLYTKRLSVMERIQSILLAAVFLVLLYQSPAGVLLYWTFNSLFSFLRIALLNPTQDQNLTPVGPALSPASKPSPTLAHEIPGYADVRPMAGRGEGPASFEMLAIFHETIVRLIKLPIIRYVAYSPFPLVFRYPFTSNCWTQLTWRHRLSLLKWRHDCLRMLDRVTLFRTGD